jgi:hypothetical protein
MKDDPGQRSAPGVAPHLCPRATLLLIPCAQILARLRRLCGIEQGGECVGPLPVLGETRDRGCVARFVQNVGGFLATTDNERDGSAAVEQIRGRLGLHFTHGDRAGETFNERKWHLLLTQRK